MKTTPLLLTFAALLTLTGHAQQPPQPQAPQAKVEPCATPTHPPAPPKGIRFHIPDRFGVIIAKQQQQIEKQTGLKVDLAQIAKDATTPKPCPAPTPVTQPKAQ